MDRADRNATRRESGSALFVAVMMLVLMGFLGLAALERVGRDGQVAGYQNRARSAFFAADAGAAEARVAISSGETARTTYRPAFPAAAAPREIGDVALYDREGGTLPNYYGDPMKDDAPIIFMTMTDTPVAGGAINVNKVPLFEGWWGVYIVGESADGSVSRMESMIARGMAPN